MEIKKDKHSYLTIFLLFVVGAISFWHLILVTYVIVYPQRIPFRKIKNLSYGFVYTSGRIKASSYGQVDFSRATINDGTGSVTVLFGFYDRIVDPRKRHRRDNLPIRRMSRKRAIRELNKPIHYDSIEVVGICYPMFDAIYAYYLNGLISSMEYMIIISNFFLTVLFIYASVAALLTNLT